MIGYNLVGTYTRARNIRLPERLWMPKKPSRDSENPGQSRSHQPAHPKIADPV